MALQWSGDERDVLKLMIERGDSLDDISAELRRTVSAVSSMAKRLGFQRPERVLLTGHPLPVRFDEETMRRIDRQPGKRSPYIRGAVLLRLAVDEAGIEGTPAELVARLRAAKARAGCAEAGESSQL